MTRKPIQRKIPSQLFVYLFFDEIAIWNRFCNMAVCKAGPPTHTCIESRFWVLKKWSPLEQQYYRGGSHNLCSDYSCPLFLIKYRRNSSVKKTWGNWILWSSHSSLEAAASAANYEAFVRPLQWASTTSKYFDLLSGRLSVIMCFSYVL